MIKYEFVFRDNIAIIRDVATGEEILHQAMRPTWGEPEPWAGEDQAREWAYHEFPHLLEDIPEVVLLSMEEQAANAVVIPGNPVLPYTGDQTNTTSGA